MQEIFSAINQWRGSLAFMTLASRIKAARIAIGLKKGALAVAVGVTPGAVTQWEDGAIKALKGETLIALASVLKVSPSWLKDGTGEMALPTVLNQTEGELIALYRALNAGNQSTLMATARAMLANQPDTAPSVVSPFQ